jgi:hypothetical protein
MVVENHRTKPSGTNTEIQNDSIWKHWEADAMWGHRIEEIIKGDC